MPLHFWFLRPFALGFLLLGAVPLRAAEPAPAAEAVLPYKNPALPFGQRVADLVGRMTLEEKAAQVQISAVANPRLGIPAWNWWSEGVHGLARAGDATIFPHAIALAATWDPPLLHRVAAATADEARAKFDPAGERYHGLTLWAPAINMTRDPRWGRIQETYGEDPVLTSRLGVAFVQGLQGDDPKYLKTVATPKHFALHSQETGRTTTSFEVSERTLRDYYLPAFYACFTEGRATSTMAAHSGINKVPCTANTWLLTDLLRGEWGFDGAVVTDWTAVTCLRDGHHLYANLDEAAAGALKAGIDVLCENKSLQQSVIRAVQNNLLSQEVLDRAIRRNLLLRFRLGAFDPPELVPFARIPKAVVGCKEHLALTRQAARESIVLLQNNPAPRGYGFERLLPLDLRRISSLAVLGPYAAKLQFGNYSGQPANPPVSPLAGLQAAVGERVRVCTADAENEEEAVKVAQACDIAVVVLGLNERIEAEGIDRKTLELPLKQSQFLQKVVEVNPLTIVVLEGGSPLDLAWMKDHVPAVLMIWYPGEQGGTALAEVLLGQYNPAGRLPLTFYADVADLPPLADYEIDKGRTYMYLEKPACYPFGYGLSYTRFAYCNLSVEPPTARGGDTVVVRCEVANTGGRDGEEVVQLYVHKTASGLKRPLKQLKAFARISIPAGQSRPVRFELPVKDLAFWDVQAHAYVVEPGTYDIMIGGSSVDLPLQGRLEVK